MQATLPMMDKQCVPSRTVRQPQDDLAWKRLSGIPISPSDASGTRTTATPVEDFLHLVHLCLAVTIMRHFARLSTPVNSGRLLGYLGVFPLLKSLLPVVVAFLLQTTDTLDHRRVGNGCTASGFLDSGLTVFASTPPRPARGGRVAPGPGFGSRTSPASTARCTSA